jgi:predicted ATPase
MPTSAQAPAVPRLTYLRIKNYRALRDVEFRDLTPLTVLIGPNGSGKSTVLDALAFLAEAVSGNMEKAWNDRDRFKGMQTRGSDEAISFELEVYLNDKTPRLRYKLAIDEADGIVYVDNEILTEPGSELERLIYWSGAEEFPMRHKGYEQVFRTNIYQRDGNEGRYYTSPSSQPIIFFTAAFPAQRGELAPKTLALANFLLSYRNFRLTDKHLKGISDAGPREQLSATGDNLPNVLYYLYLKHPDILAGIVADMRRQIPTLSDMVVDVTSDERLLLRFQDARFAKTIPAAQASEGTKRLAALLVLLREPNATGLLGLEEPENELHPHLLPGLAEELVGATQTRQLLVATHAPALLDVLEPEQLWILHRQADGYTQATSAAALPDLRAQLDAGSPLGYLWARHFFEIGNPLI